MVNSPLVCVDVGGRLFKMRKATVLKYPESLLAHVLQADDPTAVRSQGYSLFFNRNPEYFSTLVNFMRTGKAFLSSCLVPEQFKEEADFWGLPETATEAKIESLKRKRTEEVSREKRPKLQLKGLEELQADIAQIQVDLTRLISMQVPTPSVKVVAMILNFDPGEQLFAGF